MYKVYILQSLTNLNKTYVGRTIKPISVRLNEHNNGLSRYTKTDKPWKVIYYENFYCETCTDKREQFLKSGFGYKLRRLLVDNQESLK